MTLQDGEKAIFGWKDQPERQASHVIQMTDQDFAAATVFGKAIFLLDRYFLSVPALKCLNHWNRGGEANLQIVTKVKSNAVAYQRPSQDVTKRRGRPCKKEATVKLMTLFQSHATAFQSAAVVMLQRLVLIHELSQSGRDAFAITEPTECINAQEFHSKTLILGNTYLKCRRYSKTMKQTFRKAWKELFVFLEANGLDYCQETALSWANHKQQYTVQWKAFRRAVKLFEQFRNTGDIQPEIVYTYQRDKAPTRMVPG